MCCLCYNPALTAVGYFNPETFEKRLQFPVQQEQPTFDRILILAIILISLFGVILVGAEQYVFKPAPASFLLSLLGVLILVVFYAGYTWVCATNDFATTTVKNQAKQKIVTHGVLIIHVVLVY